MRTTTNIATSIDNIEIKKLKVRKENKKQMEELLEKSLIKGENKKIEIHKLVRLEN